MNATVAVLKTTSPLMGWDDEEKDLIKATVAKNATDTELVWFFQVCKLRGLNPLVKQAHFIKRKDKTTNQEVPTIQVSIEGLRLIAQRTGKLEGIDRGVRYDEKGRLYAWAKVYRSDWRHPAYDEVSLAEYRGIGPLWAKMPEAMLKKCAEASVLRIAFPEDLGGLYSHDEMDQADNTIEARLDPVVNQAERAKWWKSRIETLYNDHQLSMTTIRTTIDIESAMENLDASALENAYWELEATVRKQAPISARSYPAAPEPVDIKRKMMIRDLIQATQEAETLGWDKVKIQEITGIETFQGIPDDLFSDGLKRLKEAISVNV